MCIFCTYILHHLLIGTIWHYKKTRINLLCACFLLISKCLKATVRSPICLHNNNNYWLEIKDKIRPITSCQFKCCVLYSFIHSPLLFPLITTICWTFKTLRIQIVISKLHTSVTQMVPYLWEETFVQKDPPSYESTSYRSVKPLNYGILLHCSKTLSRLMLKFVMGYN